MSILTRFSDIMSANINALLDKAEDPEKMIDQCLRNLEKDLQNVKSETAGVMAEEKRAQRALDSQNAEIAKLESYAMKALKAGNENDARQFLTRKTSLENELVGMQQMLDTATLNSQNMRKMHDKLAKDVAELDSKRANLKAKFAQAKAQENINKIISGSQDSNRSISAFEKYEEKANQALDKATAMSELNRNADDSVNNLMSKYDESPTCPSVDAEMARLKAQLNGNSPCSSVDDELERMKQSLK